MSYNLKGFVNFTSSINTSSLVDTIGELSTQALTYSKNKKTYSDASPSTYNLIAFSTKTNNIISEVPTVIVNKTFEITNWINLIQQSTGAYTSKSSFLTALTNNFTNSLTSVDCGELIVTSLGTYYPEWISFSISSINGAASVNSNKIWYCDNSFLNQYDECELTIIPPLTNIDFLFNGKLLVAPALSDYSENILLSSIQSAKGNIPESTILSEIIPWIDPNNTNNTLNTKWIILVYGRINDSVDYVKTAIKQYISSNTTKTLAQWTNVLPDLYRSTEFYIFPKWQNYSINEMQLQVGQHNPIINNKKEIDYVKAVMPNIVSTHIENNLCVVPCQFKSLALLCLGGTENRSGLYKINQVLVDYLNIPTSSTLFELMSGPTKQWILSLSEALLVCETVTSNSTIPSNLKKVVKNNILFISFKINSIEYLVSSKLSTPNYY